MSTFFLVSMEVMTLDYMMVELASIDVMVVSMQVTFLVSMEVMILDCMLVEMANKDVMVENMLVCHTQVA